MEKKLMKILFAVAISAMLIMVGSLSYLYVKDGQTAYSGSVDGGKDSDGSATPPTSAALAPDFTYTAVNGGTVTLSALKGNVVVLDFMATWCQPCKDQIAYLKQVQGMYSGRNLVIISVNVDLQVSDPDLLAYRSREGAEWDFVTDTKGVSMSGYSVTSIPTIVIVNKQGQIAKRNVGLMSPYALQAAIDPLL